MIPPLPLPGPSDALKRVPIRYRGSVKSTHSHQALRIHFFRSTCSITAPDRRARVSASILVPFELLMKRIRYPASLLLILALADGVLAAQDNIGLWAHAAVTKPLSERLTGGMMLQFRFNDDLRRRERTLLRPSASYRIDSSQLLAVGYDAHFINLDDDKVEQRTWQQYQVSRSLGALRTILRLRVEERFIDHVSGVPVRLRIKPGVKMPVGNSSWFFSLSNEVFVAFNEIRGGQRGGYHENRAYAGLERRLAPGVVGQLGYQNQYIERAGADLITHQIFAGIALKLR